MEGNDDLCYATPSACGMISEAVEKRLQLKLFARPDRHAWKFYYHS
jgi:hypothetical protein